MDNEFETKLAQAGDTFEKIAAEHGLNLSDFTEQEAMDVVSMLMGEDKVASVETPAAQTPAPAAPAPAAKVAAATEQPQPQFTYGEVMSEVAKFAAANNFDLASLKPAELDDAVNKMAALMVEQQKPEFKEKQAQLQEKFAEADAMGRAMAHSFHDELGKLKVAGEMSSEDKKKKEEEERTEKKAALIRKLASKTAGELPPALAAHMKGKGGKPEGDHGHEEDKDEEKEKKAFADKVAAAAAEKLVLQGINPETGAKFASEEERVDYASSFLLKQKGYRLS